MGHLVSARALRLGWTFNWADTWFAVQKSDYAYFLFLCFRLRYFLLSYFYSKKRDKSSYIYSHFNIVKISRVVCVKIFFYDSIFEENKRYILPKVLKFVNRSFDSYLFRNRFINNASMGILFDSELNKKNLNWLRFFLFTKKRLGSFLNYSKHNLKLFRPFFKLFNSLVFIILIQFIRTSNIDLGNSLLVKKSKFLQYCFMKLKLYYPVKSNSLVFKSNKYNNLFDAWIVLEYYLIKNY